MIQTVKEWLNSSEVRKLKRTPVTKIVTEKFFRDPLRPIHFDPSVFYAPADGVVLYAHNIVEPTDNIIEIKGRNFTLRDLLDDPKYDEPSLVIGIFMTFYSVHINRIPTNGYLVEEHFTPFIYTHGISMYQLEQDIFGKKAFDNSTLEYLFCNERKIITVYSPIIKDNYYLIQVADKNVNVIVNWGDGDYLTQGDRFGQIRWGSQVDLILPLTKDGCEFKTLVKPFDYVHAGIDAIVKILE